MKMTAAFILVVLFTVTIQLAAVQGVDLDVGGDKGWATPASKNDQFYNDWASSNRFKVNDTLRFQYQKDSVLVVSREEYEKCRSSHPMFFSNNGDTVFTLDRPGLFYFISGVSGHCERGLKMIVKVLELLAITATPPQPSSNLSAANVTSSKKSAATTTTIQLNTPVIMFPSFFTLVALHFL